MKNLIYFLVLFVFSNHFSSNLFAYSEINNNPTGFIPNRGQIYSMDGTLAKNVLFKMEVPNLDFYITNKGATYLFKETKKTYITDTSNPKKKRKIKTAHWERVDLLLKGATFKKENIQLLSPSNQGIANYHLGQNWAPVLNVNTYKKIIIKDVYSNIDWIFYNTSDQGYKYDFLVHPGANYQDIQLIYSALNAPSIDQNGNIHLRTKYGNIIEEAPISFLNDQKIESAYQITSSKTNNKGGIDTEIQFTFPKQLDKNKELRIDPVLEWSTFYGGNDADGPMSIQTDKKNNVIVAGYTGSTAFPVALNNAPGAYYQGTFVNQLDGFIMKFNKDGQRLWSTYYGGTGEEIIFSAAIDTADNIFLAGYTMSTDFPVLDAGTFFQATNGNPNNFLEDAFIIKLDSNGVRKWATYYGGNHMDRINEIAIDGKNNLIVTGSTYSPNFPMATTTTLQGTHNAFKDAFVLKFDNDGNQAWSTFIGGSDEEQGNSICVDPDDNIYLTGITSSTDYPTMAVAGGYNQNTITGFDNPFITQLDSNGTLMWSTYFGGSEEGAGETIRIDKDTNIVVVGVTASTDFPLQNMGGFFQNTNSGGLGSYDAFISKFSTKNSLLWSTYYGGSTDEEMATSKNVLFDACNNFYFLMEGTIANNTKQFSANSYHQSTPNNNSVDYLLTCFTPQGIIKGSTYFGGNGREYRAIMTMDTDNHLLLTGEYTGNNIVSSSYQSQDLGNSAYYDDSHNGNDDGFIARFKLETNTTIPSITIDSIVCQQVIVDNIVHTQSFSKADTLSNKYGCDSLIFVTNYTIIQNCTTPTPGGSPNQETPARLVFIPNVFSPDNDNINDFFEVYDAQKGTLIEDNAKMEIYDRWGTLVFETSEKMLWNGEDQSDGTYYYVITVDEKTYTGSLTLLKK